jgi:hypothetical protein
MGARDKLSRCISDLEEMVSCHGFADKALEIVRCLADHWAVDAFPSNARSPDLNDSLSPSSIVLDPFCIDISAFASVRSIEPVLSSTVPLLFSPFSFQGLPSAVLGTQPENGGFTIASRG